MTSKGAPVTTYQLSCRGPVGTVDRSVAAPDGAYSLEHLVPGTYACTATADTGTAAGKIEVPAGATQLELVLVSWASVTGLVVNIFTGAPVPNISAMTKGTASLDILTGGGPRTDAAGRFVVERVAAGSGSLTLMTKSTLRPLATQPYTAISGQRVDVGTIKIVPLRQGDAGTLGMAITADGAAVTVSSVQAGGPAEQAGIQVGDKIKSIDGVTELPAQQAAQFLSSGEIGVGVTVRLELDRAGKVVKATVTSVKW